MIWFIAGGAAAGLLLLLLKWWAEAPPGAAKKTFLIAVFVLAGFAGLLLLASGRTVLAGLPVGYVVLRVLSGGKIWALLSGLVGLARKRQSEAPRGERGGSQAQMTRAEACDVLGVAADASLDQIQQAYKRLMTLNHPDKGGSDWMAAKLNEARQLLIREKRGPGKRGGGG